MRRERRRRIIKAIADERRSYIDKLIKELPGGEPMLRDILSRIEGDVIPNGVDPSNADLMHVIGNPLGEYGGLVIHGITKGPGVHRATYFDGLRKVERNVPSGILAVTLSCNSLEKVGAPTYYHFDFSLDDRGGIYETVYRKAESVQQPGSRLDGNVIP